MLDHYGMRAGFLAATLTGAALFVSAPAVSQEAHGVIAFGTETDQDNGVAYGFAWNFPTEDAAHAEAMNGCVSRGGTNCIQLAWFQDSCGALAMDQHGNAQGKPGMTLEQAEARALRTCEAAGGAGCNIVGSLCTTPGGEPGTYSGSESVLPVQDAQPTVTEPVDASLTRNERVHLQQALAALGFDAGPADGVFGPRTRAAIWDWQEANGHEATGYVTSEQAASLAAVEVSPDQEEEAPREAADHPSGNVLVFGPETGPKCAGKSEGAKCWLELANHPGCYFFDFYYMPSATATWSGACTDGMAVGQGTIGYKAPDWSGEGTGTLVWGYLDGHWVWRGDDGIVYEGPFVNGKQHGRWVVRRSDGTVIAEETWVDGRKTQ